MTTHDVELDTGNGLQRQLTGLGRAYGPPASFGGSFCALLASNDLLQVEEGSLYPALLRMLKAGWVSAEWGLSARNRRVRIYRITPAGRKQLDREVSAFEKMLDGIACVMKVAQS